MTSTEKKRIIKTKRYGWLPDLPDHRDFRFQAQQPPTGLPQTVDLRPHCSKVEDQGQLGSCTANAIVANLEFLEKTTDPSPTNLSRLFLYYNERIIEGTPHEDSGAFLRDGVKSLAKQGICTESSWKYKISEFDTPPPQTCYKSAVKRKISVYQRLNTLSDMKACLAANFPFVFGFSVYESFEGETTAKTGEMPMPQSNEELIGGHAVCAVGYDDTKHVLIVRNSWGTEWGDEGYFYMPYDYAMNRDLCDDFWTIRK